MGIIPPHCLCMTHMKKVEKPKVDIFVGALSLDKTGRSLLQFFNHIVFSSFIPPQHTMSERPVTVTQFHYTAWPDHGVPDNVMSVIHFIRHVRKLFPPSQEQPLLVHCSAGVGRTGTFIALDTMMQQMKVEGTISICQCVRNLRSQRMKMVQSQVSYNTPQRVK